MRACFADTSYFIALLSEDDDCHDEAVHYTDTFDGEIVTTTWVLNELANFLSRPPNRALVVESIAVLRSDPRVTIIPASEEDFEAGLQLFSQRLDKEWSIVDCISFLTMHAERITAALTKDHHFEQAGFEVLLKG